MPIDSDTIAEKIKTCGAQYAVGKRYRHPSAASFLNKNDKGGMFDIEKQVKMLTATLAFVGECGKKKQTILFVSTRQETVDLVRQTAQSLSMPYTLNRWIGGTISNFSNIRSRVEWMERLAKEKEEGKWEKFTKKEQVLMNRELVKLERKFSGIRVLEKLPDAVFVLDTWREKNAVSEASEAGIPIIGFSNANANIHRVQYPVVANIQSRNTVEYMLSLLSDAYKSGFSVKSDTEEE